MGFVSVNGRTEYSEPVQIVLGPVFYVESNGDLENGRSLRRFCAMRIDNLFVPGGSTVLLWAVFSKATLPPLQA